MSVELVARRYAAALADVVGNDYQTVQQELESFAAMMSESRERSGVVSAQVTSARELTAKEQKDLEANLEKMVGNKVNLAYQIDQNIIGGIVTRIGSTVYDSSIRTQLDNLKKQLVNG